jgi:hypothetical protein
MAASPLPAMTFLKWAAFWFFFFTLNRGHQLLVYADVIVLCRNINAMESETFC